MPELTIIIYSNYFLNFTGSFIRRSAATKLCIKIMYVEDLL